MSKTSKAYREAAEKIDRDKLYSPLEALRLAKETSTTKYDSTVEAAIDETLSCSLDGALPTLLASSSFSVPALIPSCVLMCLLSCAINCFRIAF